LGNSTLPTLYVPQFAIRDAEGLSLGGPGIGSSNVWGINQADSAIREGLWADSSRQRHDDARRHNYDTAIAFGLLMRWTQVDRTRAVLQPHRGKISQALAPTRAEDGRQFARQIERLGNVTACGRILLVKAANIQRNSCCPVRGISHERGSDKKLCRQWQRYDWIIIQALRVALNLAHSSRAF
jgi:hypothetical protein